MRLELETSLVSDENDIARLGQTAGFVIHSSNFCVKFFVANTGHHNWQPIHQSSR